MIDAPDTNSKGTDFSKQPIAKIIAWSLHNQIIVLVLATALGIAGWLSALNTPLDAIPDLTDTQIIIRTDFPGQSPQIVEDLVTYPLSTALLGLRKQRCSRSIDVWYEFRLCGFRR